MNYKSASKLIRYSQLTLLFFSLSPIHSHGEIKIDDSFSNFAENTNSAGRLVIKLSSRESKTAVSREPLSDLEKKWIQTGSRSFISAQFVSKKNCTFNLEIFNAEKSKLVYKTDLFSDDCILKHTFHFYDAAPYEILLRASNTTGENTILLKTVIEGREPPGISILKAIVLLLGSAALGMIFAYFFRYFQLKLQPS